MSLSFSGLWERKEHTRDSCSTKSGKNLMHFTKSLAALCRIWSNPGATNADVMDNTVDIGSTGSGSTGSKMSSGSGGGATCWGSGFGSNHGNKSPIDAPEKEAKPNSTPKSVVSVRIWLQNL